MLIPGKLYKVINFNSSNNSDFGICFYIDDDIPSRISYFQLFLWERETILVEQCILALENKHCVMSNGADKKYDTETIFSKVLYMDKVGWIETGGTSINNLIQIH